MSQTCAPNSQVSTEPISYRVKKMFPTKVFTLCFQILDHLIKSTIINCLTLQ